MQAEQALLCGDDVVDIYDESLPEGDDVEQSQTLLTSAKKKLSTTRSSHITISLKLIAVITVIVLLGLIYRLRGHITDQLFESNEDGLSFIDPLPSCSIINQNLTRNLLYHSWMIQHQHVHADCSIYHTSGNCYFDGQYEQSIKQTIKQSNKQPVSGGVTFRPKWLIFHIKQSINTGGLADRMKGLFTAAGLALLTGRAFAIQSEDHVPFEAIYSRSVLEWVEFKRLQPELQLGLRLKQTAWEANWNRRLISEGSNDWLTEWDSFDVVRIEYSLNGWSDLLDNPHLMHAYRAFGFHSATEKGDMDLYWECLNDYLFSFTQPVLDVLNPLIQSINRPTIKSWSEKSLTFPTFDQIINQQSIEDSLHRQGRFESYIAASKAQSKSLYRKSFVVQANSQAATQLNVNSIKQSTNRIDSIPLHCLQVRTGSNGNQQNSNNTIGFKDTQGFLKLDQLPSLFERFSERITAQSIDQSTNQSIRNKFALLITSDLDASLISYLPSSFSTSHLLAVPGRTAHINNLDQLKDDYPALLEVVIKATVTHFLLGECNVAVVTQSGFGPTALWRSRNRHLEAPIESQAWDNKYVVETSNAKILPYLHLRGGGGRDYPSDHREIPNQIRQVIEAEILTNTTIREAFRPGKHGKYQASAALDFQVPVDPRVRILRLHR